MILKMILKSFEFQCDFDFQITTSKMIWILILNHLYLGDLILILKSSTYDDFAHLWLLVTSSDIILTVLCNKSMHSITQLVTSSEICSLQTGQRSTKETFCCHGANFCSARQAAWVASQLATYLSKWRPF